MPEISVRQGRTASRLRGEFSVNRELNMDSVNNAMKGMFEMVSYDRGLRMVSGHKRGWRVVIHHDGTVIMEEMKTREELESLANDLESLLHSA